jgi:hypothetical protein
MEKVNIENIKVNVPRMFGKAKLAFIDPKTLVVTPKLPQMWNIRPSGDDGSDKFSLEVQLNENGDALKSSLAAFDMKIRSLAFVNKKAWFGKEADEIKEESDLRMKHTTSIKKGGERQDGSKWNDSIKFKVTGWGSHVSEVVYKGEGDKKMPYDVKWKSRIVDAQGAGGPDDGQTKFYICEGVDMATGKEKMAPWTPCTDPAGNQIKDAVGNTVWEFVGPKHCQPGCELRIVFQPTMVWISSKFGVTLAAKQVFITPAPPKAKTSVEGIEIVETVDPIMAIRATKQALARNELNDLEMPPEDDVEVPEVPVEVPSATAPAKKAASEDEKPKKKKAKVSEDF